MISIKFLSKYKVQNKIKKLFSVLTSLILHTNEAKTKKKLMQRNKWVMIQFFYHEEKL